jgi:hypothetical protein
MSHQSVRRRTVRIVLLGIAAITAPGVSAAAQELVTITVPSAVSFAVTDVSRSTSGVPSPTRISFSNAILIPGRVLRISVQAGSAGFTPPSGASIPSSNVSWTNLGATSGTGWNGSLSSSSYTLVYQSDPLRTSGHIDLGWTLAAPGSGIRAGNHQLTIRWKVESIAP